MTNETTDTSVVRNENPSQVAIAQLRMLDGQADECHAAQMEGFRLLREYLGKGGVFTTHDLDSLVELATSQNKYGLGKIYAIDILQEAIFVGHDLTTKHKIKLVSMARRYDHRDRQKFRMDSLRQAVHSTHSIHSLIQIACGKIPREVEVICGFVEPIDHPHIIQGARTGLNRRVSKGIIDHADADIFIREMGKGSNYAAIALSEMVAHGLNLTEGQIMDLRGIRNTRADSIGILAREIANTAEDRKSIADNRSAKLPIIRAPVSKRESPRIARTC
ncbi:MAG: hypothetical protein Q7S22_00310 [Candidatus Micrarchaeota archaeon]|nr:hypothetical protein [Candidatus Micrarchaeota archaeon]